jgi:hypothetical protein
MLTLERDGSLLSDGRNDRARTPAKETIELPAILVLSDGDLIDRVLDVVFERLGRCVVVLRIHADLACGRPAA